VIHTIRDRATTEQMKDMLEMLETYVKLAVDIEREILAGGGAMHADWNPSAQQVTFESLINIRARQNNPSMEIFDPKIREQVTEITVRLLGGV
jgi:hypothetical protein